MAYTQEDINAYIAGLKAAGLEGDALYERLGQEAVNAGVTSSQVAAGLQAAGEDFVTQPIVDKYLADRGMQSIADQGVTDQAAIDAYVNQSRGLFADEGELFNFLNQQRIDYGIGDEAMASAVGVRPEDMYQWLYESGANTEGSSGYGGFTPSPVLSTGMTDYAAYDKRPEESLTEYYGRLASGRSGGILGTRDITQGMLASPSIVNEVMETQIGNGQAGAYTGNSSDSGDSGFERGSLQDQYEQARWFLENPEAIYGIQAILPGPMKGLFTKGQIEGFVRNMQNEATGQQGFWDYLMGRDGDVVTGNLGTGSGSLVTGEGDITDGSWDTSKKDGSKYDISGWYPDATPTPAPTATYQPVGQYMDFDFGVSDEAFEKSVLENGLK